MMNPMLLVMDIGNTETELGLFPMREDGTAAAELVAHWRVSTPQQQTADEHGVLLRQLFTVQGLEPKQVRGIIVASVVPPLDSLIRTVCERTFGVKAIFVEPGVRTGMPVHYDNPAEVGADRIANSVAAFERCKQSAIVVDFGTAITFDAIGPKGEYLGGVIARGVNLCAVALFAKAARLPRVEVKRPAKVIGTNTVESLQSGFFHGYVGLVDGILERLMGEMGVVPVLGTGSMAPFLAAGSRYLTEVDETLTLTGLRLIWERNRVRNPVRNPERNPERKSHAQSD